MHRSKGTRLMIAVFTLPALLAFLVVFAYPVIRTILMSFFEIDNLISKAGEWQFVGLANYEKLLNTGLFMETWKTLAKIWVYGGIAITVLSLLMAVILTSGVRGKSFFRAAIYLPNIISAVALANMWIHYAYNAKWGLFYKIFSFLRLESLASFQWTAPDNLFFAMMFAYTFGAIGYYMLIYISGIEKIPQDIFESATIDGASKVRSLFSITLPMMKGIFSTTLTLWTTNTLGFYVWSLMFSSRREPSAKIMTPVYYMFLRTFGDSSTIENNVNAGSGAAICVMVMLVAIVMFGFIKLVIKDDGITY